MRRTAPLLLLLAICWTPVLCTSKKKLLETLSFDIKPSGQITHQKIKLVSHAVLRDQFISDIVPFRRRMG